MESIAASRRPNTGQLTSRSPQSSRRPINRPHAPITNIVFLNGRSRRDQTRAAAAFGTCLSDCSCHRRSSLRPPQVGACRLPQQHATRRSNTFCKRVTVGEEELGPVAHVPFDGQHVIGLEAHHLLSFTLVIEVPSTASVNPTIRATRLSFHPRHESQLHNYSSDRQRILVPVFATGGVGSGRSASAPPRQRPAPAARAASGY